MGDHARATFDHDSLNLRRRGRICAIQEQSQQERPRLGGSCALSLGEDTRSETLRRTFAPGSVAFGADQACRHHKVGPVGRLRANNA